MPLPWYDLLPDVNPDGSSLSDPAVNAGGNRCFRHAFSTGSNSSVNAFVRYNQYARISDSEIILGLYKVGSSTNLLQGTSYVSSVSGSITHSTTIGTLRPSVAQNYENTSETPNVVFLLESSSSYYIISRTAWNDSPTSEYYGPFEFDIALQDASSNILLTYESTTNTVYRQPWVSPQMDTSLSIFKVNDSTVLDGSTITLQYASSVTVIATPTQSGAAVDVSGNTNLGVGNNTLTVTVTALNGITSQQYIVTLNMQNLSADTSLSTFKISGYSVTDGATLNLSYRTSIQIDVVPTHPGASWTNNNFSTYNVTVGSNPITIQVTAENGTMQQDYSVTVNIAASLGPLAWHEMLPDLNPDGTPLMNPAVDVSGERYYKHAFNTGSDSTVELFMRYEQFSLSKEKIITGIYKVGNSTNLIGDQSQPPPPNVLIRLILTVGWFTDGAHQYGLSPSVTEMDYPNFGAPDVLLLLEPSTSYYIISKTNENNSIAATNGIYELDVALRDSSGNTIPLTYESTQNTAYTEPWTASVTSSLPTHVPVSVNFNVAIDADSKIILFGEDAPTMQNFIVAEQTLPVTALYDASGAKGLIEIWEPTGALGNIRCQLANDGGADGASLVGAYKEAASRLASGLQAVLEGVFDCSGATPFDDYAANEQYYKQENFGRVALGAFAHYLFGHVDATAAITNDAAFVTNMLTQVTPAGDVETWDFTSSITSANLANRLVKEIIRKGKDGPNGGDILSTTLITSDVSGGAAPASSLAEIVKQVIGQDSSRVQNADGSQRTLDKHILLRFFAGDVIYVKINVMKPTVEVSGSGANPPANTLVVESETSYNLKITLA